MGLVAISRKQVDVFYVVLPGYTNLSHNFTNLVFVKDLNPGGHFISKLSLIVRVHVVLNRTVVVDSD